jgi:hypothetical protein
MKTFKSEFTPAFISQWIPGKLVERKTLNLKSASELDEAEQHSICFYQNKSFYDKLLKSKAGLIFVPANFDESLLPNTNLLKVENPYIYYMMLIQKWLELEKPALVTKHYASTEIHETAEIAKLYNTSISAHRYLTSEIKSEISKAKTNPYRWYANNQYLDVIYNDDLKIQLINFYVTRYKLAGYTEKAVNSLKKALSLTTNKRDSKFIKKKLLEVVPIL